MTQARAVFDSAISILTVFNEDKQLFLAETGLGGMKEVPREVTFCSHAVLQRPPQPFILNDTHEDWRFSKSPLVTGYGCRAYYGVPLLAPDFSGNSREPIPIGTLCIIDNKPRDDFTPEQRSKMGDLALLAQKTIANWSRARLQARLDLMEKSFLQWRTETQALTQMGAGQSNGYSSDMEGSARAIGMTSLTSLQHQQKLVGEGRTLDGDDASRFSEIPNTPTGIEPRGQQTQDSPVSPALRKQPSQRSTRAGPPPTSDIPPLPVANGSSNADDILHISKPAETPVSGASESYVTAPAVPTNNKQKIYDISTRLVGTSLELTLVYILRLEFANETRGTESPASASDVKSLSLISAFGLPSPEPAFDAILHLKALRSEEGGLLYQNPNIDDLVSGEKLPDNEEVEYASALLVPVAESGKAGYVLAGFTDDPERVFERSDLEYMHTIASEVSRASQYSSRENGLTSRSFSLLSTWVTRSAGLKPTYPPKTARLAMQRDGRAKGQTISRKRCIYHLHNICLTLLSLYAIYLIMPSVSPFTRIVFDASLSVSSFSASQPQQDKSHTTSVTSLQSVMNGT